MQNNIILNLSHVLTAPGNAFCKYGTQLRSTENVDLLFLGDPQSFTHSLSCKYIH